MPLFIALDYDWTTALPRFEGASKVPSTNEPLFLARARPQCHTVPASFNTMLVFQQWARAAQARKPKPGPGPGSSPDVDWSYSLHTGKVAAGMYSAKFSFDINATADCTNDFVVFALDVAG